MQLVKRNDVSNCRTSPKTSRLQCMHALMLIPDTEHFLVSGRLSFNKLNPREAAARTDPQLLLHVSSQGEEITAGNTSITGAEITSSLVLPHPGGASASQNCPVNERVESGETFCLRAAVLW